MKKEILEKLVETHKNILVSGDLQTGKTRKIIKPLVNELIFNNESFLMLDSKEEYLHSFYQDLKDKDYNIIIFNLKDTLKSDSFNPLEYPYQLYKNGFIDKAMDFISNIGKNIFYELGKNDQYWLNAANDLFEGIILGLFEDADENQINLNSVYNVLSSFDKMYLDNNLIDFYFNHMNKESKAYICAKASLNAPLETRLSLISLMLQKLKNYIISDAVSFLLSKNSFNYNDFNKKIAIFFVIRDDLKDLNDIASIFIEQLFHVLVEMNLEKRFNFVLDNFDDLKYMNNFNDMMGSSIERNIRFIIGTRYKKEMIHNYGRYINRLCDEIMVLENEISCIIGNRKEVFKDDDVYIKEDGNIIYPHLDLKKVNVFELENYLLNKYKSEFNYNYDRVKNEIDQIIEKIDNKISELKNSEK